MLQQEVEQYGHFVEENESLLEMDGLGDLEVILYAFYNQHATILF